MKFISKFLKEKGLLIEINDDLFKIAKMTVKDNKIMIKNIDSFIIKNQGLRKKEIKEFIIKYINKYNLKLKNNNIYTTLDNEKDLFIKTIEIPGNISKRKLEKTIDANLNNYLPFQENINLKDFHYDYHIIKKDKNYKILLTTAKKSIINKYSNDLFLSQDNNFYHIYLKPLVLFNTLKKVNQHETSAILNFSKSKTHLIISEEGNYKFHKTIDVGKNDFLKIVSKQSSVEINEIDITTNYFKKKNTDIIDYDLDLRNIIEDDEQISHSFLELGKELLQEIDMAMAYFNNKFKNEVKHIYLVENQEKIPGLYKHLNNNLSTSLSTINNEALNIDSKSSFNENAILFSTAISSQM